MASVQLKQTLLDLHAQLAAGEHLDPELHSLLQLLESDIHQRLQAGSAIAQSASSVQAEHARPATGLDTDPHAAATPADRATGVPTDAGETARVGSSVEAYTDPAGNGLSSRAQEISARFAAAHPHLEPVLRELTDTLQRIGI